MTANRIAVLGGGAWGTALAETAVRAGRDVTLWEFEPKNAEHLAKSRESKFLPGFRIDDAIKVTRELGEAAKADAILMVIPAQAVRAVTKSLGALIADKTPVIVCAKGIEHGTHKFMTEIVVECAPKATPAILSGPSFASDVARGLPTAVTLACKSAKVAETLAHALNSATFRPYHSTDVRGVEIGGAAKNVLAIAAGIVAGRGLGASASAAHDDARLCRAGAVRQGVRRQGRNAHRPLRPRRSDIDVRRAAVAQLLVRRRARQRRTRRQSESRQVGRRRVHRAGPA